MLDRWGAKNRWGGERAQRPARPTSPSACPLGQPAACAHLPPPPPTGAPRWGGTDWPLRPRLPASTHEPGLLPSPNPPLPPAPRRQQPAGMGGRPERRWLPAPATGAGRGGGARRAFPSPPLPPPPPPPSPSSFFHTIIQHLPSSFLATPPPHLPPSRTPPPPSHSRTPTLPPIPPRALPPHPPPPRAHTQCRCHRCNRSSGAARTLRLSACPPPAYLPACGGDWRRARAGRPPIPPFQLAARSGSGGGSGNGSGGGGGGRCGSAAWADIPTEIGEREDAAGGGGRGGGRGGALSGDVVTAPAARPPRTAPRRRCCDGRPPPRAPPPQTHRGTHSRGS